MTIYKFTKLGNDRTAVEFTDAAGQVQHLALPAAATLDLAGGRFSLRAENIRDTPSTERLEFSFDQVDRGGSSPVLTSNDAVALWLEMNTVFF